MKKALLVILTLGSMICAQAQSFVSVHDINYRTSAQLAVCNDTSDYLGDTVITYGIVVIDGNRSEVSSGTVPGGNRPFIFIVDTANGGVSGDFNGLEVMGTNEAGSLSPPPTFTQVIAGDIVKITGVIGWYNNSNQISLLDANSFSVVGSASAPVSDTIEIGVLNDANRVNNMQTGEEYEGAFVTFKDVTVVQVIYFSGNSRISFDAVDANGNRINVSDRFLAQKLPSWSTVNPNSPQTTGSFSPPVVGTFYTSLSGVVRQDGNGCTGGTGRGYELNPFDSTHYEIGYAPPFISNVERDPLIPTSNQTVDVECNVVDFDGTLDSAIIAWSADTTLSPSQFPKTTLGLVSGSTSDFINVIPAHPDGTFIRYYIYAEDNDGNKSYYPTKPLNQPEPNVEHYFVRDNGPKVFDIQYSLLPSGASPLEGRNITVKGIVTASTKLYDLGFLYIQDEGGSEWSGIWCVGSGLSTFFRGEEVMLTGTVEEDYGMTQLNVSQASKTGNKGVVTATTIDPTDSALYANSGWEKWEGVLVRYEHPQNQKLFISQENLGFGDYAVGASANAPLSQSGRILAGRQSGTSYSSLFVQLVTDTVYRTLDGFMNVNPIEVSDTMNMDAVEGIIYYGFSNYRLLPRNNDDFIGINVVLDSTNLPTSPISVTEFEGLSGLKIYPNPATEWVNIGFETEQDFNVTIYDMRGEVMLTKNAQTETRINLANFTNGMYIISLTNNEGQTHFSKIIITK